MSEDLDELFGSAGEPKVRTGLVVTLLSGGLVMAVLGMACSAVPGGLVVLGAWAVVDKEQERVESGYLPASARGTVRTLRRATFAGMVFVGLLFLVQLFLLGQGFYDSLWEQMLRALYDVLGMSPTPEP